MYSFNLINDLITNYGPYTYLSKVTDQENITAMYRMVHNYRHGIIPHTQFINGESINTKGNPIGIVTRHILQKYGIFATITKNFVNELADKIIYNVNNPNIKVLGLMSGTGLLEHHL